jgi:hypothetical protein
MMNLTADNVSAYLSSDLLAHLAAQALAMMKDLQHMSEATRSESFCIWKTFPWPSRFGAMKRHSDFSLSKVWCCFVATRARAFTRTLRQPR